jgi:hypothetical protein
MPARFLSAGTFGFLPGGAPLEAEAFLRLVFRLADRFNA